MQYENFSRPLHRRPLTSVHNKNMIKAQREISFPLISYLNNIECDKQESNKQFKPYLNEGIRNNRRHSDRDRQICYENLILAKKLERIKKQPGQNARAHLEKDYQNHCRLLTSKANCEHKALNLINRRCVMNQSSLSNARSIAMGSDEQKLSETTITSGRSSPSIDDDQATAADVDASMESCDSRQSISRRIHLHQQRNNRNFNYAPSVVPKCKDICSSKNQKQKFFETDNDRVYQHLNNIDMTMVRDTVSLSTLKTPRHFSICILPHFDVDATKSMNKQSKNLSHDRKYAFKKEILYY